MPEAVIHWDLIGMKADDPKLIEAIKTKVLWKPPTVKSLNLGSPSFTSLMADLRQDINRVSSFSR